MGKFEPENNIEETKKILNSIYGKTKMKSCKEQAIEISIKTSNMLKEIVKADMSPEEDSALFLNTSVLILKQIMYNTAIIADYVVDKELKGGTN